MIQDYLPKNKQDLTFAPTLAHRIDRETSGIILIAKTKKALESLTKQFKDRTIHKTYQCYVHGVPSPKKGLINAKLLRTDIDHTRKPKVLVSAK